MKEIEAHAFVGLANVVDLDMYWLKLGGQALHAETFLGLSALRRLSLSSSELKGGIEADAFAGLTALVELDLSSLDTPVPLQ